IRTLSGHPVCPPATYQREVQVYYLQFSPDGQQLISAGGDARLCHWNVGTGNLVQNSPYPVPLRWVNAFSRDGRLMAFHRWGDNRDPRNADALADLVIWDFAKDRKIMALEGTGGVIKPDVAFTTTGRFFLVAYTGFGTELKLWETASGQPVLAW